MRRTRPYSFELDFSTAFDLYLQVMYDAEQLTVEVGQLLHRLGVERVLDCAAGSGVPSIGLRRMGLPVVCSDGSPEMVERFKLNAKRAGLRGDIQCDVADWSDLDPSDGTYDYVMCRGNSLVYASTWGTAADITSGIDDLERYVQRFAAVVEPGGWLHIDAPLAMSSGTARTIGYAIDDNDRFVEVSITECVIERATSRYWRCIVSADWGDGEVGRLEFGMHSAKLTIDVLADILGRNGFVYWGRPEFDGDRASHPALLARRALPSAKSWVLSAPSPAPLRCRVPRPASSPLVPWSRSLIAQAASTPSPEPISLQ